MTQEGRTFYRFYDGDGAIGELRGVGGDTAGMLTAALDRNGHATIGRDGEEHCMAVMTILCLVAYGALVAYLASDGRLPPEAIAFAAGSIAATVASMIVLETPVADGISLTLLPAFIAFPALAGGAAAGFVAVFG